MTYMPELRSSLVQAARSQHAAADEGIHARSAIASRATASRRRRPTHAARSMLASLALGLTGTAVGAVHVGAPLGPESPPSVVTHTLNAPGAGAPRP
jgi:hypothetical protein